MCWWGKPLGVQPPSLAEALVVFFAQGAAARSARKRANWSQAMPSASGTRNSSRAIGEASA
jgi:hypothetical protein